jgi:DNA-binding transcriptional LysR family regulator
LVALSRREADIAITLQPPVTGRFHISRLTDYDLYVYGSSEYLSRCAPIVTQADYGDHPFAGYIDDLVFVRDLNYLDKIGARVRPKLQSSSIHAQLEFVRQGYGLCVLPSFVAASAPDLVRVRPDLFSLRRSYWIVANPDIIQTARGNALINFLENEVKAARENFIGPEMDMKNNTVGDIE